MEIKPNSAPEKTHSSSWNLGEVLTWTTKKFTEIDIPTPRLDAILLICHALSIDKITLFIQNDRPLTDAERTAVRLLVKRRIEGEPVAYITGRKYWHEFELFVDDRVLIPRPETETLFDITFALLKKNNVTPDVIFDLCTGSGCLAFALAKKFPNAKVVGVDKSERALEVANINAQSLGLENVTFVNADLEQKEVYKNLVQQYSLPQVIVANPPYVSEEEWNGLDISVRDFEPKEALVSNHDTLYLAQTIIENLNQLNVLDSSCILGMELAHSHPGTLKKMWGINSPFGAFDMNDLPFTLPKNQWFAMRDLEEKERFLMWNSFDEPK